MYKDVYHVFKNANWQFNTAVSQFSDEIRTWLSKHDYTIEFFDRFLFMDDSELKYITEEISIVK